MNNFVDENIPYKKKVQKKRTKKSNHKHEYKFEEIKEPRWFTHVKICKICGKESNKVRL